jgi:dynactin complex subunit
MSENSSFKLNQRIQVGYDRGTILYIGQVNRIKGEVLGIEWDNAERGKHSGNFEGVQYFTTVKPNSGSFLKQSTLIPSQTTPTPDTKEYSLGTDLFDSIILKYATFDTQREEVKLNNSSTVVEAIGFEESFNRQKQVENLKVISLLGYCISKSENNEKLRTLTSKLITLKC